MVSYLLPSNNPKYHHVGPVFSASQSCHPAYLLDPRMHAPQRYDPLIATAFDNYRNDPRLLLADGYVIKSSYFDDLKQKIAEVLQRKGGS
jgi:hypothetical protein